MTDLVQEKERAAAFRRCHMTALECERGQYSVERVEELLASYASEGRRETTQAKDMREFYQQWVNSLTHEQMEQFAANSPNDEIWATTMLIEFGEAAYLRGRAEQLKEDVETVQNQRVDMFGSMQILRNRLASALREKIGEK